MRNLKKILALVLALVMSLSLMATASATEFPDDGEIDDTYRVAVEVLSGLNVFAGDQNGKFNPKDPIRRSEVAAIIYRIATGDVTNERNNSYTPYNQFSDVITGDWFAGYVTYCANAGYIKGRNDGKFDPYANVTGYEVLAMILRAVGYDKNNEFVGSNWQLNTASIAQQKGVLKNITGTTKLSEPATRETVAELLFRSILLPKVTWNANSLSYTDGTTPLATETLGLEEITGVVMANQWADLESGDVMAEGKTRLKVDGKDYPIDYTSALTDIGESRHAYIQGSKVFVLDDTGKNVVKDNEGAETTVSALRGGLNTSDAEYFVNFSDTEINESEWLIRYAVTVGQVDNAGNFLSYEPWYAAANGTRTPYGNYLDRQLTDDGYQLYTTLTSASARRATVETRDVTNEDGSISRVLTVSIQPEEVINSFDQDLMRRIFYTADRFASNPTTNGSTNGTEVVKVDYYVRGEVYVGTTSLEDKSDIMSWNQFVDTYIVAAPVKDITAVGNGNWLKIIDNDGDGKAEYVLLTVYTLDKVVNSATKNDTTTYYYQGLDLDWYTPVYLDGYSPAVGDVVLYALIDGTAQMHLADTDSKAFRAVNYKERQATDTEGTTWEQSDIWNRTLLPDTLTNVDENVVYTLYLDDYGYVRAYDNKTTYALVTEIYPTNYMNQAWLTGRNLTAEVMTVEDEVVREYNLVNSYGIGWNPFFIGEQLGWTYDGINDGWWNSSLNGISRPNYLHHAAAGLGTEDESGYFTYSTEPATINWHPYTWTNVAKYTMTDDGINLNTATEITYNSYGNISEVEDYIQLKIANVSPSNPLYDIEDDYWNGPSDDYVRAVDDTEFFVVARDGKVIKHYTGYTNVPALTVDGNGIRAMYAVAETTEYDRDEANYWVANVIVIEIDHFTTSWDSVALIYSNDYKVSGDVKYLQAIDSKRGDIGIIPNGLNWQGQFTNRGFYALSNVTATETEGLYRADIVRLYGESRARAVDSYANLYGTYDIHYGVVRSFNGELTRSSYITVDEYTGNDVNGKPVYDYTTHIRLAGDYASVWGISGDVNQTGTALDLILDYHANKQVQVGDEIIWVEVGSGSAGFVVDLTSYDADAFGSYYRNWSTPGWLCRWDTDGIINGGEALYVMQDQIRTPASRIGSFYGENFFSTDTTVEVSYTDAVAAYAKNHNVLVLNGYTVTSIEPNWPGEPTVSGANYTIKVTVNGKECEITLKQLPAASNELRTGNMIASTGGDNSVTVNVRNSTTIAAFIENVEKNNIDPKATTEWTFIDNNGKVIAQDEWSSVFMTSGDVSAWYLTITSDSGEPNTYHWTEDTSTNKAVLVQINASEVVEVTDPANGIVVEPNDDGTYTIQVISETQPVAEVNGVAYTMTKGAEARSTYFWSVTLTEEELGLGATGIVIVYIRAYIDGEDTKTPDNSTETNTSVKVTATEAGDACLSVSGSTLTVKKDQTVNVEDLGNYLDLDPADAIITVTRGTEPITAGALEAGDKITLTSGEKKTELTVAVATEDTFTVKLTLTDADGVATPTATEVTVNSGETATFTVTVPDTHELKVTSPAAATADKKNGTVTITLANVTAESEVKATVTEIVAIETNDMIQAEAASLAGPYSFYRYGSTEALTEEQIVAALAAGAAKKTDKAVEKVELGDTVGTATVTFVDGSTQAITYTYKMAEANSCQNPGKLYAIQQDGVTLGYYKNDNTAVDIATAGLAEGTYLIREGQKGIAITSSDANKMDAVKVDANGKISVKVTGSKAVGKDIINYVTPVVVKEFESTVKTSGITAYTTANKGGDGQAVSVNAGDLAYLFEQGAYIEIEENTKTTAGLTAALAVNGTALTGNGCVKTQDATGAAALKFFVAVKDLTPNEDGEIKIGVTHLYKVRFVDGANSWEREPEDITKVAIPQESGLNKNGVTLLVVEPDATDGKPKYSGTATPATWDNSARGYVVDLSSKKPGTDGYIEVYSACTVTVGMKAVSKTESIGITLGEGEDKTVGEDIAAIDTTSATKTLTVVKGATLTLTSSGNDKNIVATDANGKAVTVTDIVPAGENNPHIADVTIDANGITISETANVRALTLTLAGSSLDKDSKLNAVTAYTLKGNTKEDGTGSSVLGSSGAGIDLVGKNPTWTKPDGTAAAADSDTLGTKLNLAIKDVDLSGVELLTNEITVLVGDVEIGTGTITQDPMDGTWYISVTTQMS